MMLVSVTADKLRYHDVVVTDLFRRQIRTIEKCLSFPSSLHLFWENYGGTLCLHSNTMLDVSKVKLKKSNRSVCGRCGDPTDLVTCVACEAAMARDAVEGSW